MHVDVDRLPSHEAHYRLPRIRPSASTPQIQASQTPSAYQLLHRSRSGKPTSKCHSKNAWALSAGAVTNGAPSRIDATKDESDAAEASERLVRERRERVRECKAVARELFARKAGDTSEGRHERLGVAEETITVAMQEATDPTLFEFRSLVRSTRRDFEPALTDARAAIGMCSDQVRTSALLREARALSGLGRFGEAGRGGIRALDRSPQHESLTTGFEGLLPVISRSRVFYTAPPKAALERVLDDGLYLPIRKPSEPRDLLLHVPDAPAQTAAAHAAPTGGESYTSGAVNNVVEPTRAAEGWLLVWSVPLDDGDDEILHYRIEESHEDPFDPTASFTAPQVLGNPRELQFQVPLTALHLPPATPIRLHVKARNGSGFGPAAIVESVTPERPLRVPQRRAAPPEWAMIDVSDLIKQFQKRGGADAASQFAAVHAVWSEHVGVIRVLFRYFCLQGNSLDRMGLDVLFALAKSLRVLSKQLTREELQLIFVRANINRVDDDPDDRPDQVRVLQLAHRCMWAHPACTSTVVPRWLVREGWRHCLSHIPRHSPTVAFH